MLGALFFVGVLISPDEDCRRIDDYTQKPDGQSEIKTVGTRRFEVHILSTFASQMASQPKDEGSTLKA